LNIKEDLKKGIEKAVIAAVEEIKKSSKDIPLNKFYFIPFKIFCPA
jgi:chaperonin GroEL (HSP60 family)